MSLRITMTRNDALLDDLARAELRSALEAEGKATMLVPSHRQALDVQRQLAGEEGLALSVTVSTPSALADERWEVWGDGRRIVGDLERLVLMRQALDERAGMLAATTGTLDALAQVARSSLAWVPEDGGDARWALLSEGDRAACEVLWRYRQLLAAQGLVERCEAMALLGDTDASWSRTVVTGFAELSRMVRALVLGMARHTDVLVALSLAEGFSGRGARAAALLAEEASSACIDVASVTPPPSISPRPCADELALLWASIHADHAVRPCLDSTGVVRLLEPSGPLARWELVARETIGLLDGGAHDVVVAVPDADAAWRGLAPKLAARGTAVACATRCAVSTDVTASAFLGFARVVAQLAELSERWPQPLSGPEGPVPQLGDMSWWPPRELTDFLLCDAAQVDAQRAWELDAKWRGNRSLTPQVVLAQLQREGLVSKPVAQATASLLRGRVGTAALQLARSLDESGRGTPEALSALASIQEAARTVGSLGVSAVPKQGVRRLLALSQLVALISELVGHEALFSHRVLGPQNGRRSVRICTRGQAAALQPLSADAMVCCGLTSVEWSLAPHEDAASQLLLRLGLDEGSSPLEVARGQFAAMLRVPRSALLLERMTHDEHAQPTYPAVVLSEALACYLDGAASLPTSALDEGCASSLLSASGNAPQLVEVVASLPTGVVGPEAAGMVVVPREGEEVCAERVVSLSASQIESYLECPYKWFTLRRLGLGDLDAGFSPLQTGSFAHRVMEVSRRRLTQEAAERAGLVGPGQLLSPDGPEATFVPDAAITASTIGRARELLSTEFDYHLMHQRQRATTLTSQSLVPHSATEELRLDRLRRELLSVLDYELTHLEGFSPRYFELRFGGSSAKAHHVTYAGVDFLGSIDRVDVDEQGHALVIDYKHMGASGFAREYDAFREESPASLEAIALPRRVQSLIYAQVVRRLFPQLEVVGAVYLSTLGLSASEHELAGVLDASVAMRVMGGLSDTRWRRLVAGGQGKMTFHDLLDATEELVAQKVACLLEGHIEADPVDDKACAWCPVANCVRRRG